MSSVLFIEHPDQKPKPRRLIRYFMAGQGFDACIIACCENPDCARDPYDDWPLPVHRAPDGSRHYEPDDSAQANCPDCGQPATWITY